MATLWIFVTVFILQFVSFYPSLQAAGIVEIKFVEFSNPTGMLYEGFCCDYKYFWSDYCAPCDHQFIICLGNISESSSMNSCEFGKVTTGKLKSNQIEFTNDIGGVANPIKVGFNSWTGFMKVKINALDKDSLDTFDFVDHYEYQYNVPVLNPYNESTPQILNLTGTSTSLKLEIRVHCDEVSFGPKCDIICIPRNDEEGHYFCDQERGEKKCLKGWTGQNCTINIDDCKEHQCQSEAICVDGIGFYTCLCPLGRTGQYCEGEINECASLPCLNGGRCFDGMASFKCSCMPHYTGERCETLITPCDSQPCLNNATCHSDSFDNFICICHPGSFGQYCEIDHDECMSNPCKNWATCIDHLNGYECLCQSGYKGTLCELDIDECKSNPCQNGGNCINLKNNFSCICPQGMTGRKCENDIDECLHWPCSGNGNCTNSVGSFYCSCFPGFTGEHCHLHDPCLSAPCKNNGSCSPLDTNASDDNYTCACPPGFNGTNCEYDVDECAEARDIDEELCRNGGSCVNTVGSFECVCPLSFTGPLCEVKHQTSMEFDSYTQFTTEDNKMPTFILDNSYVKTDEREQTTFDYSKKRFSSREITASLMSSSMELKTAATEGLRDKETDHKLTFKPTTIATKRNKTNATVTSSTTSKSTSVAMSAPPSIQVAGTTLHNEDVTESTLVNFRVFFEHGEDFVAVEEVHNPIALTTKRPKRNVVTDCVLIKIFGINKLDSKPEKEGAKKEICWLVFDSISRPLADVNVTVTRNRDEAYKWTVRTLKNLTPVTPRPVFVEKEVQSFLGEFQMILNEFSRYRSTSADKSPLNSDSLQVLIKTKRKGRGYFKNKPNNPYIRYIKTVKFFPRSLASKMILYKTSDKRTSTTRAIRTTRNRYTPLLQKLQTSTHTFSSIKIPVGRLQIVLRNLNNTHVQKRIYYPQRKYVQDSQNIIRPSIAVTVFRSARKVIEAGSEKARQAYLETKIVLHKTLRQLSSLWTAVHRISNVMYIPVAHSKKLITKIWNAAWIKARSAYSAARDIVHRAYQQARENFREVYDRLKKESSYLSTKYYQLYRDHYKEYTKQVSKASDTFMNTYNNYALYLTQYWKKYIKGDQNVDVIQPPRDKENPFINSVGNEKGMVKK